MSDNRSVETMRLPLDQHQLRELVQTLLWGSFDALFISGYTADVMAHRDVLCPGVHFLSKPFNLDALALKVRETISLRKQS